ncbi:hypothetical protein [Caballeronia grimmiae]|uniref:Type IV secretion protein Rhs n=1 Tax=Caballeronia grimmiae TaxID=1071679 RepID=A0A069P4V7_9BURK|nr:hypothetical protein [Caballeronia grimmiae]KDR35497.1 hypothetical protein BG57_29715 [Caballeronia grimmiae]
MTVTPSMVGKIEEIQPDDLDSLANVIRPVLFNALSASQASAFALPNKAMPTVIVTNDRLTGDAKGVFEPRKWTISINTAAFGSLFLSSGDAQADRAYKVRKDPMDCIDTMYHETRHCQQHFWIFAMVQQRPADFEQTPNIARWPQSFAGTDSPLTSKAALAAKQPLPDDQANLLTIKQMAVGMYAWHLFLFEKQGAYLDYANDARSMQKEYELAKKQAEQLLINAGPESTAIDVEDMAEDRTAMAYNSKPWEDDAFYCGAVAGAYWSDGHAPDGLLANQCSRQYAAAYNNRKLSAATNGNASGPAVSIRPTGTGS